MSALSIKSIEHKILTEIPILKSMKIQLMALSDDESVVTVELAPNHNHKGTAFGGSLYCASVASCYSLLYHWQTKLSVTGRDIVIAHGGIQYVKPVEGDFVALAKFAKEESALLMRSLHQSRTIRIPMRASVRMSYDGKDLCVFEGDFAFVRNDC